MQEFATQEGYIFNKSKRVKRSFKRLESFGVTSDVHLDLFHDSWFTGIQQNSCRFDAIQLIYDEIP